MVGVGSIECDNLQRDGWLARAMHLRDRIAGAVVDLDGRRIESERRCALWVQRSQNLQRQAAAPIDDAIDGMGTTLKKSAHLESSVNITCLYVCQLE